MNKFKSDLKFGQFYENECKKYFKNVQYVPQNIKFSNYDFISDGIKYEVKSDRVAHRTKNLCIEIQNYGKPSGLSITQAEYYIYFIIHDNIYDVYKIPINILKEKIINCKCIYGGDYKKSKFHLLKLNEVEQYIITEIK